MDIVRELAGKGEPHGTVILADFQESGRGRQGRPWITDKGQNLMFSIFLKFPDFSAIPGALTLKTGLAVSLAIENFVPGLAGSVKVKWPNDIMLLTDGAASGKSQAARKAVGILTEAEGAKVYIGIGVNLARQYFPPDLQNKAGSLLSVYKEKFPGLETPESLVSVDAPYQLLEKILHYLYNELEEPEFPWKSRLEERLYKQGETVSFAQGAADSKNIIQGHLAGIGEGGELLLIPEGEEAPRAFTTGELQIY